MGLTPVGPRNHVLDGVQVEQTRSQLRGLTSRRCDILPDYFGNLLGFLTTRHMSIAYLCHKPVLYRKGRTDGDGTGAGLGSSYVAL